MEHSFLFLRGASQVRFRSCFEQDEVDMSLALRLFGSSVIFALFLVLSGCGGSSLQTVPVAGKVTVAGKPFTKGGTIVFYPDSAKGNESTLTATGDLNEQGEYRLTAKEKSGAPAGWYKVTISSQGPSNPKDPYSLPKNFLDVKYGSIEKTTLALEVKEGQGPEAYTINIP